MNRLARAWNERSEGERRALGLLAAVAAIALLAAFAWLPMERARARLARDLPALRASIALLERDAAEVARLRAMPVPAPTASSATAGPQSLAALATNGGGLAGAQIAVLDAKRVRVSGPDIGWQALLEWLGSAEATHAMRVESARLDALAAPGRVRAELVLSRP